jgi:hypothetical protein
MHSGWPMHVDRPANPLGSVEPSNKTMGRLDASSNYNGERIRLRRIRGERCSVMTGVPPVDSRQRAGERACLYHGC